MVFRSAQGTAWSAAVAAIRSSMLQKHCPHTSLVFRPLHSAAASCSTAKIKAGRGECERHNLIRGVTNPPTPRHTKLGGRPGVHALCGRAGPAVPPGSGSTMPTNGGGIIYDDSTLFRKRRFFSTSSESLSNTPPPPLKLTTAVRCRTSKDARTPEAMAALEEVVLCDCGHDAFFACDTETHAVLGIADGVGGWTDHGVDPALFAWMLMADCTAVAMGGGDGNDVHAGNGRQASAILHKGYSKLVADEKVRAGSSTAIVATLERATGKLDVANLGDSVVAVVRRGELVLATGDDPQQHKFNAPYQLAVIPPDRSSKGQLNDHPSMAQLFGAKLEPGDVLFMATDGYSDNVFREMTLDVIKRARRDMNTKLATPVAKEAGAAVAVEGAACDEAGAASSSAVSEGFVEELADQLLAAAYNRSISPNAPTPFQRHAELNGHPWTGGKRDDITVMVALVEEDNERRGGKGAGGASATVLSPVLAARCSACD